MDWLGKAIGLPEDFLTFSENTSQTVDTVTHNDGTNANTVHNSKGGGVLQVKNEYINYFLN